MKKLSNLHLIIFVAFYSLQINPLQAQETVQQALDGIEIGYSYTDGRNVIMYFDGGLLDYRWITGPSASITNEGIPYKSHEVAEGIYFINWEMPRWFISFAVNFNTGMLYVSTLRGYGTEQQSSNFDSAVLNSVER